MIITKPNYTSGWIDNYIAQVAGNNLVEALTQEAANLSELIHPLDDTTMDFRYAEGKWSIREIVCHLTDTERVFSYRALRFARQDKTELPGYDENLYAQTMNASRRSKESLIEEHVANRMSTIALFKSMEEEMLDVQGIANGTTLTARALGFSIVGHVFHHCRIIRERYLVQ